MNVGSPSGERRQETGRNQLGFSCENSGDQPSLLTLLTAVEANWLPRGPKHNVQVPCG